MATDMTTALPMLKVFYEGIEAKRILYKNRPLFAMIPKRENVGGSSVPVPVIYNNSQNRSSTVSGGAFSGASTFGSVTFQVTTKTVYGGGSISNQAIKASKTNAMAFVDLLTEAIDRALDNAGQNIATQIARSGTGSVAQIASTATINSASTYVALANPDDIVNLAVDMNIAASQTDGGSLRAYASTGCYIVKIDRPNGSFLCSATMGGSPAALNSLLTSVAVGDYIYQNASDLNAFYSGIPGWIAGSAVTSSSFYGVDRTVDKSRLAGITFDGSGLSMQDAIYKAAAIVTREGGRADKLFLNYADYTNLQAELRGNQVFFTPTNVMSEDPRLNLSFSAIALAGPAGTIHVMLDPYVPTGKGYLLQMDSWELVSVGPPVELFNGDGLDMLRDSTGDLLNFRITGYGNILCKQPGFNAIITFNVGS